jgi:hypothetical protein
MERRFFIKSNKSIFASYLLPALRVSGIKVPVTGAAGYCRTAPTPSLQFAFAAFLELVIVPISLKLICPKVCQSLGKNITHLAILYSSTGINITCRKNGKMPIAAVAAAIYHIGFSVLRNL